MCKAKKRTEKCQTKYRQIGGSALRQQRINGARRTQTLSRYATWSIQYSSMHVHSPAYTSMCYICVRVAVLNELSERTSRKHRRGCSTPGKNSDIEQQARAMSVRVCVCVCACCTLQWIWMWQGFIAAIAKCVASNWRDADPCSWTCVTSEISKDKMRNAAIA